jgi:hypothetical protein
VLPIEEPVTEDPIETPPMEDVEGYIEEAPVYPAEETEST